MRCGLPAGMRIPVGEQLVPAVRGRLRAQPVERGPVLHGQGQVVDARPEPVVRLVDEVGRAFQEHVGAVLVRPRRGLRPESAAISQPSSPSSHSHSAIAGPGSLTHRSRWCSARNMALIPRFRWPTGVRSNLVPPPRGPHQGGACRLASRPQGPAEPQQEVTGRRAWGEQEVQVGALGEQEVTGRRLGGAGSDGSARWGVVRRGRARATGRPMPAPISRQLLDGLAPSRARSRPSGRWSPPSACRRGRWRRPRSIARVPSTPSLTQRRLDVVDPAVQQDPGHRVHGEVVAQGRPGAGDAGEVDRRGGVHERQRHELGEAAGLVLDAARARAGAATQCRGLSTWPYIIVELDAQARRGARW